MPREDIKAANNDVADTESTTRSSLQPKPHVARPRTRVNAPTFSILAHRSLRPSPSRIISIHNVPIAAAEADIRALLGGLLMIEFKRRNDPDAGTPSSIVFLLFSIAKDARVALRRLNGMEVLGQVVTAEYGIAVTAEK
ncbi:hypothetical protein FB567DRAFT_553564 [Paraphoma chrysanthemicola]|uniref:RRM domain-containing protein n=1 Tax=Paraphoma chrysanthemicola TaxID=798071 RepID=A0A8K0VU32_9PLEO|nr:hypothetical protein FB567DRAFT_553564 [Paraphoma chrysanthemicola]